MTPEITLGLIVLVPVLILMLLRINAVLVFLSLCLGNVLGQFVARDSQSFFTLLANSHATDHLSSDDRTVKLVLLLFPVVLTTAIMIHSIKGKGRLMLNLLPAAGAGLLGALLVIPLLPPGLSHSVIDSSLWSQIQRAQDLIVGVSALVCLMFLWLARPKASHDDKKHSKH